MTYRSIYGTSPSYLQSCFTRVADVRSRRRLQSSTSHHLDVPPVRLSTAGFWCHHLERPASPRRICAVTRSFQTTTRDLPVFPFLPRHYHMTRVTISIHHYCLDTRGPCNNEHYLGHVMMMMMMKRDMSSLFQHGSRSSDGDRLH